MEITSKNKESQVKMEQRFRMEMSGRIKSIYQQIGIDKNDFYEKLGWHLESSQFSSKKSRDVETIKRYLNSKGIPRRYLFQEFDTLFYAIQEAIEECVSSDQNAKEDWDAKRENLMLDLIKVSYKARHLDCGIIDNSMLDFICGYSGEAVLTSVQAGILRSKLVSFVDYLCKKEITNSTCHETASLILAFYKGIWPEKVFDEIELDEQQLKKLRTSLTYYIDWFVEQSVLEHKEMPELPLPSWRKKTDTQFEDECERADFQLFLVNWLASTLKNEPFYG